jgi:DNA-binding SARP family transcriptional activator
VEQIQSLLLMGTPALHIRLFGPLELAWGNEPLTSPPSPTTRSLLAYLIFHHDHPITRDRLTGIFWPERPDTRARHALSNALWQVRHALGPAADRLAAERDTITLTLQACDDLDAATFETQVQREPNQAIALYRADLLEGCYDDWVVPERERLRELHLGALERLIDVHKQRGDYDQALLCARRLVAADPLREAAHCEVMRLSHLLGRSQAALEQFATLRDLLAEELGVDPVPATVDLYEEIGAALGQAIPYTPIAPPPPPLLRDLVNLPFIGRTEERGALLEALHAAAQGQGRLALIEGDAGVGKTRLVDEAIADARWRGFQVGMGKGDVATTPSPYRVLRDALAPLLTELRVAQLAEVVEPLWLCVTASIFPFISEHLPDLPALARLEPQEEKQRLWEGLARLLAGLASVAPLLLVLEDIHWADEATLDALLPLALSLPAARLALTLTYRTAEARERPAVWEALEALDRVLPPTRLYLHPFERAETAALVRRALGIGETGGQVDAFAARLYEETGGNALLLVENLKVLLERDLLTPAGDGGWILPPGDVPLLPPVSIQGLIGERLARLAPPLRATLELVAVLGEEAEFAVLSGVSGAGSPRLLPTLEGLTQRGFLVEAETRYHFRHDCIQEVAYGAIALGERQWTHHRAGVVLERLHPERIEALAHHYERGHAWDKAVHYHWRAGEHAAGLHAYPVALHHYSRAVSAAEAAGLSPDERFDLLAAREAVLEVLGRREEQAADLEVMEQLAVGEGDPRKLAEVYRRRAWLLAHASRYDEAEEVIRKALALAEQQRDETAKAAALIAQGMIVGGANRVGQAVLHLREAVEIYRQQGDRAGEARARSALGDALASMTSLPAAEAETQSALSLYQSLGDRLGEIDTLVRLGRLLLLQGGDKAAATTCHQRTLEVGTFTQKSAPVGIV